MKSSPTSPKLPDVGMPLTSIQAACQERQLNDLKKYWGFLNKAILTATKQQVDAVKWRIELDERRRRIQKIADDQLATARAKQESAKKTASQHRFLDQVATCLKKQKRDLKRRANLEELSAVLGKQRRQQKEAREKARRRAEAEEKRREKYMKEHKWKNPGMENSTPRTKELIRNLSFIMMDSSSEDEDLDVPTPSKKVDYIVLDD